MRYCSYFLMKPRICHQLSNIQFGSPDTFAAATRRCRQEDPDGESENAGEGEGATDDDTSRRKLLTRTRSDTLDFSPLIFLAHQTRSFKLNVSFLPLFHFLYI